MVRVNDIYPLIDENIKQLLNKQVKKQILP